MTEKERIERVAMVLWDKVAVLTRGRVLLPREVHPHWDWALKTAPLVIEALNQSPPKADIPMVHMFRGKNIEDMSRAELIESIKLLGSAYESMLLVQDAARRTFNELGERLGYTKK